MAGKSQTRGYGADYGRNRRGRRDWRARFKRRATGIGKGRLVHFARATVGAHFAGDWAGAGRVIVVFAGAAAAKADAGHITRTIAGVPALDLRATRRNIDGHRVLQSKVWQIGGFDFQ